MTMDIYGISMSKDKVTQTFPMGTLKNNRIYHHTVEGTRESHPSVHDLQSTTRLAESWMLQIMDTRMGFPCPFHNVVIDYFSPTPISTSF